MVHKLMAFLVSSAVIFGSSSAVFAASGDTAKPVQASGPQASPQMPRNPGPLPAGGAAGIQQAQGTGGNDWLLLGGSLLAGALILVFVAGGGDNDDTTSTSGTN